MCNILQAILLLVALAYAEPEAAPDAEAAPWYYGYYGHPGYYGGWGGYYSQRWGGYYGWGGYPYSYGYRYWKRDSEDEGDEPLPQDLFVASPALPLIEQYSELRKNTGYRGYSYGLGKRNSEDEAKPAMLYTGYYGHYPTTLHYGVAGYPYAHHPYALAHPAVTYAAPTVVTPTVVKPYT